MFPFECVDFDVVGPVTGNLDPHAFWKKECDPVALTALSANAWSRSRQMIAWIEGSFVPFGDSNGCGETDKGLLDLCAICGPAIGRWSRAPPRDVSTCPPTCDKMTRDAGRMRG